MRIRSFVRREGRMSPGQLRAFTQIWPKYGLNVTDGPLNVSATFNRVAPTIVEIGFGNGQSLLTMAKENPNENYIGIEVHRPGVGSLLIAMQQAAVSNIRIYQHDAIEVLQNCISDHSLDRVQLYFPDPWPKNRHHKRRIVQSDFIGLIAQKLKTGGVFHCATDWQPYAEWILEKMSETEQFSHNGNDNGLCTRPDSRPTTKYEMRGITLGHTVYDLLFTKN